MAGFSADIRRQFDDHRRPPFADRSAATLENRQLVAVDINLDQINALQLLLRRVLVESGANSAPDGLELTPMFRVQRITSFQRPTGIDLLLVDLGVGAVRQKAVIGRDARNDLRIAREVAVHFFERPLGRFERVNTAIRPDQPGEGDRVRPDVGSDIQHDGAGAHEATIEGNGARFEAAEKPDGEVDPFAQVKVPTATPR